jgi:hypothetical protein
MARRSLRLERAAAHQFIGLVGASRQQRQPFVQDSAQAAEGARVTEAISTRAPTPMVDETATLRR